MHAHTYSHAVLTSHPITVAYAGAADAAVDYFQGKGHLKPEGTNAAEFLLDLVNSEFTEKPSVDRILAEWRAHEAAHPVSFSDKQTDAGGAAAKAGFATQLTVMLRRHACLAYRDPTLYTGRILLYFIMSSFFAIVYVGARDLEQQQVLNHMWIIIWYTGGRLCYRLLL
jgi:hypothetical protein